MVVVPAGREGYLERRPRGWPLVGVSAMIIGRCVCVRLPFLWFCLVLGWVDPVVK